MKYKNIHQGVFLSRPNRFIAHCLVDGKEEICHVKNTGRCKELLTSNATVWLEKSGNSNRKTAFDLVCVKKGDLIINMDSQAPNKVFLEWAQNYFGKNAKIYSERKYKNSRFDFYIEKQYKKIFAEIKGVTLEENGVCLFPDAPTERGVKHINELICAKKEGYEAHIFFVVQMSGCKYFTPNEKTHPEFKAALIAARKNGVNITALECEVSPNELKISGEIPVIL